MEEGDPEIVLGIVPFAENLDIPMTFVGRRLMKLSLSKTLTNKLITCSWQKVKRRKLQKKHGI